MSILAWRRLARSEYESLATVIHLYKIYTCFDLGVDTQISQRGSAEKFLRGKYTTIPPLRLFIYFSQCKEKDVNYLPDWTRPEMEGGGKVVEREGEREKKTGTESRAVNTNIKWKHSLKKLCSPSCDINETTLRYSYFVISHSSFSFIKT